MAGRGKRRHSGVNDPDDLFSTDPSRYVLERLSLHGWPDPGRIPVNHVKSHVRMAVWSDLVGSPEPLVVAGFSAIASLVGLATAWDSHGHAGPIRLVLGSEPFTSDRVSFAAPAVAFSDEARDYWLREGVSIRLSAGIIRMLGMLEERRVQARFIHGRTRLHAKVYVGADAVTVGSSNFTDAGLRTQLEANVRFERAGDPNRYAEVATVAENYWAVAEPWDVELADLLRQLLRFVTWREALARACADLLEGQWAEAYVRQATGDAPLWPSQRAGIAQALWIVENVGSVLVADATGSGKTRMGAHLTRAVRDRLWSTGRVRRDLTVLVSPPQVEEIWNAEAVRCGLPLRTVSHGLLSRRGADGPRVQEEAVRRAQILAIDEAHNFLSPSSNRTQRVRASSADHVLLFTATPINAGARDLLQLVDLLGADNFDEQTLAALDRLERRSGSQQGLTSGQQDLLRREIQRFTVRRTKSVLNAMVDAEPDAYRHPDTGRICRYPRHDPRTYRTGESAEDEELARRIRQATASLVGATQLGRRLEVPPGLRADYSDETWLSMRLASARGLAGHHVLSAMRSSTGALVEHIAGTAEAVRSLHLTDSGKTQSTGDMLGKLKDLLEAGPPVNALTCPVPDWLTDPEAWRDVCREELDRYRDIQRWAMQLSGDRERAKAELIASLTTGHDRVLAFDHHPITLAALRPLLEDHGAHVVLATGADPRGKRLVQCHFARDARGRAVALCSDALSEGLNLQGASVIVHLDLPTTLRVAEQRVGRVDRMDSPHDSIEAWWPRDGEAFATRANELLAARAEESHALLGANLVLPDLGPGGRDEERIVDVTEHIARLDDRDQTWDGIRDALDPVRGLVVGPQALLSTRDYDQHRHTRERVLARVSPLTSHHPWAFVAVAATQRGAPRWMLFDGPDASAVTDLDAVAEGLRRHLADDPPARDYDEACVQWLDTVLARAEDAEKDLLPRRHRRALEQMARVTARWATDARRAGHDTEADGWERITRLGRPGPDDPRADPYRVAEVWLTLVRPHLDEARQRRKGRHYLLLRDIDSLLASNPLPITTVQDALADLPPLEPIDRRISACILGVPKV